ncbi:MAG: hypothetical protein GC165_07600 [Armatimonadetes bacterium]|nr:hypothetical protein [Armatimonadota bacterium]
MATTKYHTVMGQMIGETSSAGAKTEYLVDALGSVAMRMTAAENLTLSFKPYGTPFSAGAKSQPKFGWLGSFGYRYEFTRICDNIYVRARHYGTNQAMWTTRDPLWPVQSSHGYADGSPTSNADPSGLIPIRFQFDAFIPKRAGFRIDMHNPACPAKYWFGETFPFGLNVHGNTDDRDLFDPGTAKHISWATAESTKLRAADANVAITTSDKMGISIQATQQGPKWNCTSKVGSYGQPNPPPVRYLFPFNRNEECCSQYVRFVIQACTSFLPYNFQQPAFCINYDVLVKFAATEKDKVTVIFPGQADGLDWSYNSKVEWYPAYEALLLSPKQSLWGQYNLAETPGTGLDKEFVLTRGVFLQFSAPTGNCP